MTKRSVKIQPFLGFYLLDQGLHKHLGARAARKPEGRCTTFTANNTGLMCVLYVDTKEYVAVGCAYIWLE